MVDHHCLRLTRDVCHLVTVICTVDHFCLTSYSKHIYKEENCQKYFLDPTTHVQDNIIND